MTYPLHEVHLQERIEAMERKQWTRIDGYPGYFISVDGDIKLRGRILKHSLTQDGYHQIKLIRNGWTNAFYIHQLVCKHFNEYWEADMTVDHLDMDKDNNHASNLECVSRSENVKRMHDAKKNKTGKYSEEEEIPI